MLNKKYGIERGLPEHKLQLAALRLSKTVSPAIKKSMQTSYLKSLSDSTKNAVIVSFKKDFPEHYRKLAEYKASILGGRDTVRAKYIYLLAFGSYPTCRICKKPSGLLGDRPGSKPVYCCKVCRYEGLRLDREASLLVTHGVTNAFASKEFSDNRISYLQNKYGEEVTGPTKVPGAMEKVRNTSLTRFGVSHFAQSPGVKAKRVRTIQKEYGKQYTAPFQLPHVKEAIRKTTLARFGVEHNSQSPKIKAKKIQTSQDRYGTDYPSQSQEVKDLMVNTNLERYGVRHPAHLPGWVDSPRGYKRYTVNWRGKEIVCQGYEVEVLNDLMTYKNIRAVTTNSEYIGVVPYVRPSNGKEATYHPDLAFRTVKGAVVVLEVKSTYTLWSSEGPETLENNIAKFKAAARHYAKRNIEFALCVWVNNRSVIIREPHIRLTQKLAGQGVKPRKARS